MLNTSSNSLAMSYLDIIYLLILICILLLIYKLNHSQVGACLICLIVRIIHYQLFIIFNYPQLEILKTE